MDLQLVRNSLLYYTRRNRKWVVLVAALGFSSYGAYKVYNSPSVARKRARVSKLLGALMSIVDVISDSAETIGVVSRDFKDFLESDSDQIPNSLKQISKVVRSNEVSDSVITITRALTVGILRGHQSCGGGVGGSNTGFLDKVLDKLSSPAGSGFVSAVVGSFARNMVLAIYQGAQSGGGGLRSSSDVGIASANDRGGGEMDYVEKFVGVVCGDKCKELIGDCVKLFVSTAVAVYLDKTLHINPYNDLFVGMTNPKHEKQVKDVMISVCNGAIETLVKTSHEILTKPDSKLYSTLDSPRLAIKGDGTNYKIQNDLDDEDVFSVGEKTRKSLDEGKNDSWVNKVSSTLAVPSNRRLVLDVTGRVTFETVRSFLEVLVEKLYEGIRRCIEVVHQSVIDTSNEVVSYVSAKTSVLTTLCLTICLHILDGAWILMPA